MTVAPKILLADHLKTLKLPTFLREYDKLARQCSAEDWIMSSSWRVWSSWN